MYWSCKDKYNDHTDLIITTFLISLRVSASIFDKSLKIVIISTLPTRTKTNGLLNMLYLLNKNGYFLSTNLDIQAQLEGCTLFSSKEEALAAYNQKAFGDNKDDHGYIDPIFVTIDKGNNLTTTTINEITSPFTKEDHEEFLAEHGKPLTAANYINEWIV